MANRKSHFELSLAAEKDLEDVFSYTDEEYELDQAIRHLIELDDVFEQLVENPELERERNEIKKGLKKLS